MIEEFAKSHDAEPQITAFSEYGREKNGLRFPSRNYSEQAYISPDKCIIVNARISVVYKKYNFFTVERKSISSKEAAVPGVAQLPFANPGRLTKASCGPRRSRRPSRWGNT